MSAENCIDTTRCPCPCLPKVTLEQAVIDLVAVSYTHLTLPTTPYV